MIHHSLQPCQLDIYREQIGYTKSDLMRMAGYTGTDKGLENHYNQIIRGERVPPINRIYMWSQLFGVPTERIFLPSHYTQITVKKLQEMKERRAGLRHHRKG